MGTSRAGGKLSPLLRALRQCSAFKEEDFPGKNRVSPPHPALPLTWREVLCSVPFAEPTHGVGMLCRGGSGVQWAPVEDVLLSSER